jgi:hypothetical protein
MDNPETLSILGKQNTGRRQEREIKHRREARERERDKIQDGGKREREKIQDGGKRER